MNGSVRVCTTDGPDEYCAPEADESVPIATVEVPPSEESELSSTSDGEHDGLLPGLTTFPNLSLQSVEGTLTGGEDSARGSPSSSARSSQITNVGSSDLLSLPLPTPNVTESRSRTASLSDVKRVRRGFWNRRGDHLTWDLQVVLAPQDRWYPTELEDYPAPREGYLDHFGVQLPYNPNRPELPGGAGRYDSVSFPQHAMYMVSEPRIH
jgi:hypothetical protein